jgi:mannitol/fructose-specific phosphotransferase system IIA component (Ntr-type)
VRESPVLDLEGPQFPGQDEPVRAAFVLVRSSTGRSLHLQALAAISSVVGRDDFQERWLAAKGPDELRDLLL